MKDHLGREISPLKTRENRIYRAIRMLALKKRIYDKFVNAYGKDSSPKTRKEFDNFIMPWLETNYDIETCPEPNAERRLWPSNWPGAIPLNQPVRPTLAPWAK